MHKTPVRHPQTTSVFSRKTLTPRSADLAMDAAAANELEDEGDVEGYPREGLCLAVLGDGRAHPAWLCRTRAPAANGRRRVLLYGDGRGASRALNPSERVDPLPGDAALCARLQQDWRDASPGDRDGLLRALDELEARRCAPPSFAAMVKSRAAKESEIPNFKGSYLGRFPLVSADFWTSDHLSERSRSVGACSGTRARGTLTLKRR